MAAASMRAAHLHLFEGPKIHEDTFALRLIGVNSAEQLRASLERWGLPELRRVSAYFALRHRFSEERLDAAVRRGAKQIVLLGAGLDSFALRRTHVLKDIVFVEVDHPATQQWKLERLAALGLKTPAVKYVPVDFASRDLKTELTSVGVKVGRATFFAWLGVTQYISAEASYATLSLVSRYGAGSEIVFDVIRPVDGLPSEEYAISDAARASASERGEPWVSYFVPEDLESQLGAFGFTSVTCLTAEAAARYYVGQPAGVTPLTAWELIAARI
jgi:methyltransferase (TIGR00027 family)